MKIAVLDIESLRLEVPQLGVELSRDRHTLEEGPTRTRILIGSLDNSKGYEITLRRPNIDHLPDPEMCEKLKKLHEMYLGGSIHPSFDCSEISESFAQETPQNRELLIIHPKKKFGEVLVPQFEPSLGVHKLERYNYHSVFCRRGYVFDPRLHHEPIPKGDYRQIIRGVNKEQFSAGMILVDLETQSQLLTSLVAGTFTGHK